MSTITREQAELKSFITGFLSDPAHDNQSSRSMTAEVFRIALASMTAEPVGEVVLGEHDDCGCHPDARVACIAADGQADWENFKDGTRLYTAPPAPMLPEEMPKGLAGQIVSLLAHNIGDRFLAQKIWNACRAAMLQGAEPVTTADKLHDGWVDCSERMPERDVDVQVYCADKKEQMVGYMEHNEQDGYFRFASLPNGGGVYCQPTHWMPLPTPPQK